jgi:hypothetical protein
MKGMGKISTECIRLRPSGYDVTGSAGCREKSRPRSNFLYPSVDLFCLSLYIFVYLVFIPCIPSIPVQSVFVFGQGALDAGATRVPTSSFSCGMASLGPVLNFKPQTNPIPIEPDKGIGRICFMDRNQPFPAASFLISSSTVARSSSFGCLERISSKSSRAWVRSPLS